MIHHAFFQMASTPAPLPPSTWQSVIDAVTGYMTPAQIVAVLASVVGAGVIYYCTFFAGCFLYRLVKNKNKNWFKKLFDEFSAYAGQFAIPTA